MTKGGRDCSIMLLWCKNWVMAPELSIQNQNFTRDSEKLKKNVSWTGRRPKVGIHRQFLGIHHCLWRFVTSTPHRSEFNGIGERAEKLLELFRSEKGGSGNDCNPTATVHEERDQNLSDWCNNTHERRPGYVPKNLTTFAELTKRERNVFRPKYGSGATSRSGIDAEGREYIVDSSASMHMMSKVDLAFEEQFQIGNADPLTAKKDERRTSIRRGKYSWKTLIWENRNRSLTMFIWVALKENVKQAKIWWTIIEKCLNPKSLLELPKSYLFLSNLAQTALHGPMTWKVMQRNAWRDIANLRIKRNKPTTVLTGNGTKRTTEHATLNVEDLDMFVTVQLLKDSPAELSLGTLRRTLVFVWIERKSITKFLQ